MESKGKEQEGGTVKENELLCLEDITEGEKLGEEARGMLLNNVVLSFNTSSHGVSTVRNLPVLPNSPPSLRFYPKSWA